MKLSSFKKIDLKNGDPVVVIWDDIVERGEYKYDPNRPADRQMARFIFMGWFLKRTKDKIAVTIEPEMSIDGEMLEPHPFRTVQLLSVGDIYKIARLPEPKEWWE